MAPVQKKEEINLHPQKAFESGTVGRVLAWVLSSFRIIVIVTEIIVMIAFLSRFWLDAQNTDLNDEIKSKKTVLEAYQDFESDFRDAQKRISVYSTAINNGPLSKLVEQISNLLPLDVRLSEISYNNHVIQLTALSTNETSIQQYIVNLGTIEKIKDISLSGIESDKENPGITKFTLTMSTKEN